MQLRLQIQRKQFRALGFDDGNVLITHYVLEGAKLLVGNLRGVVESHDQPRKAVALVHGRDAIKDRESLLLVRFQEIGGEGAHCLVGIFHFGGFAGAGLCGGT